MKNLIILFPLLSFYTQQKPMPDLSICGKSYKQEIVSVYLKDYNLPSQMVRVIDKHTKKLVFGYQQEAIRNDTNFISSKVVPTVEGFKTVTIYRFNISRTIDSTVSDFSCRGSVIRLRENRIYKDGRVRSSKKY